MKGFEREDQLFSLCGLNCGLCSMHLGGYCPGCGGGAGNQACAIARCAMQKEDTPMYCSACSEFPCERYAEPDAYDSFITHRNCMQDFMRMHTIGAAAYHKEQLEKIEILKELLSDYNDGRRKTLFTLAVNLLELKELRGVMQRLSEVKTDTYTRKEKAELAASLLQEAAAKIPAELKLRKKPKQKSVG